MVKANYKYPYFTQTELMKHIAAMWNQSDEKKASDARRIAAADERSEAGTSAAASRCQASSPQGSSRPNELRPESCCIPGTRTAVAGGDSARAQSPVHGEAAKARRVSRERANRYKHT